MSSWTGERSTAGLQRPDLERRVSELERLVGELLKVIKLTTGCVRIASPGMVQIRGVQVTLEAFSSIDIKAGASCKIQSALLLLNGQQAGGTNG